MDFSKHQFNPNSQLPIGKSLKPIANSQLVDAMLEDYAHLIDASYAKWFARRFQYMSADEVAKCASEAKADGKDPKRLFSFLIKKRSAILRV